LVCCVDVDAAFLKGGILVVVTALTGAVDIHLADLDCRIDIVLCGCYAEPGNECRHPKELEQPRDCLHHAFGPRGAD
jgi:hypothetical protein